MDAKELIERYKDGQRDFAGIDLIGANLHKANLRWAKLHGANMYKANLSGADLSGANLSEADLTGADLTGADLSGANLSEADLTGADLRKANLDFACFPLWCGSFGIVADDRLVFQLVAHITRLDTNSCSDDARACIASLNEWKNRFCKSRYDVEEI